MPASLPDVPQGIIKTSLRITWDIYSIVFHWNVFTVGREDDESQCPLNHTGLGLTLHTKDIAMGVYLTADANTAKMVK